MKRYLAAKLTPGFDWSVVDVLDWIPYKTETGEVLSIDAMSTSVGKISKTSPSFTREWWFLPCLGAKLARMLRLCTATSADQRSRSLLLDDLLLLPLRRQTWTMFMTVIWMATGRSTVTMAGTLHQVVGKGFGLYLTVIISS